MCEKYFVALQRKNTFMVCINFVLCYIRCISGRCRKGIEKKLDTTLGCPKHLFKFNLSSEIQKSLNRVVECEKLEVFSGSSVANELQIYESQVTSLWPTSILSSTKLRGQLLENEMELSKMAISLRWHASIGI